MSVQKYIPCDALKSYIDFYWLYNAREDNTFNQLLPAGYVDSSRSEATESFQ